MTSGPTRPISEHDRASGAESALFDLPSGTESKATAQALVDYLNRQGWKASMVRTPADDSAKITIDRITQSLSVDAKSGSTHTDLTATNTLALQIMNHTDEIHTRARFRRVKLSGVLV